MRNLVVGCIMNKIKEQNKYDDTKLIQIKYGLEAIYLNVSRFTVFFIVNALLGTFLEGILFLLFYIPLRSFSFGFHAKNSLTCWILSSLAFVGLPYISTITSFNIILKLIIILSTLIIYIIFSPADTPKRPIINRMYRFKLKIYTLIFVIIYSVLILFFDGIVINIISLALIYQSILITPILYKVFNVSYNNYLFCQLN